MASLVLDCSVTAAWFFEDEFSSYSERVRQVLALDGAVAVTPGIWPAEITNVLFQSERRKRIKPDQVNQALSVLARLPIETDTLPVGSMSQVLQLCRAHRLTAYDALYLELALRRNIPLATQDKLLTASAIAAGARVFDRTGS